MLHFNAIQVIFDLVQSLPGLGQHFPIGTNQRNPRIRFLGDPQHLLLQLGFTQAVHQITHQERLDFQAVLNFLEEVIFHPANQQPAQCPKRDGKEDAVGAEQAPENS